MMTNRDDETIRRYLGLDENARAGLFGPFDKAIKSRISDGDASAARDAACRAVTHLADYSTLARLGRIIRAVPSPTDGEPVRMALLGGPTLKQLAELLDVFLCANGVPARFFLGGYRSFRMELLAPDSELAAFRPQIIILAVDERDLLERFDPSWNGDRLRDAAQAEADAFASLWTGAGDLWGATVIQNLFDAEPWPILGNLEFRHGVSRSRFAGAVNAEMRNRADAAPVFFHDIPYLVGNAGARHWYDPRFYNEAKMPCSPECLPAYAHSLASLITALRGGSRKMLVLDLDNTLWGGTVGDVGPYDILVGQGTGEGEAFLRFQQYVKELSATGVILGVCTKNDPEKAAEPFKSNPDMLLRLEDFASFRAGWGDKSESLRHMAREVNLGLDALVLVDDNPMERALVRTLTPEVGVPDLPADPSYYITALAGYRYFERVAVTDEDRVRSAYYSGNAKRNRLRDQSVSLASFLESLDMIASSSPIGPANIERAAQLIGRSNQFNLTGLRIDKKELGDMAASADWRTLTVSLRDNCGDNGLVSVVVMAVRNGTLAIEGWVMSCRVLQRRVENWILSRIAGIAREAGCAFLEGIYRGTEKNGMVEDLYPRLGFRTCEPGEGVMRWRVAVDDPGLQIDSPIREAQ